MANGKTNSLIPLITIILTIITLSVAAVVWATSEHADQKDWTMDQDRVTKKELEEKMKEEYVRKHEFTPVQNDINTIKESILRMETRINKVLEKRNRQPRAGE